jgi:hypothetical protein
LYLFHAYSLPCLQILFLSLPCCYFHNFLHRLSAACFSAFPDLFQCLTKLSGSQLSPFSHSGDATTIRSRKKSLYSRLPVEPSFRNGASPSRVTTKRWRRNL